MSFWKETFGEFSSQVFCPFQVDGKVESRFSQEDGWGRLICRGDDREAGGGEGRNDCNHEADDPETLIVVKHT